MTWRRQARANQHSTRCLHPCQLIGGEVKQSILGPRLSLVLKSFLRASGSRSPHPPLLTFPIVLISVILVRPAEYFMKVVVGGSKEVVVVVVVRSRSSNQDIATTTTTKECSFRRTDLFVLCLAERGVQECSPVQGELPARCPGIPSLVAGQSSRRPQPHRSPGHQTSPEGNTALARDWVYSRARATHTSPMNELGAPLWCLFAAHITKLSWKELILPTKSTWVFIINEVITFVSKQYHI